VGGDDERPRDFMMCASCSE